MEKRSHIFVLCLICCMFSISPMNGYAAFTDISNIGGSESLIGQGGILDTLYGLDNVKRIDDDLDQLWKHKNDNNSLVQAEAKFASYSQSFGYIRGEEGNSFSELFTVSAGNKGYLVDNSSIFSVNDSGNPFRFGNDPEAQYAPDLISSAEADNLDKKDHMLTWYIMSGEHKGNYVLAWEDLVNLGDRDYNDLVVEISGIQPTAVPEPASIFLLGSGLLGLFGLKKKKA
jgi:Domain of unknown function (DUF4114)/PEP-CTERM motif